MEKEIPCEGCGTSLRQIGPFASSKPEGLPAKKFDGVLEFQCVNEECIKYEKIIEINIKDLESYMERMQKVCQCGHARHLHGHSLMIREDGQPAQESERDGKCATNCNCTEYKPKE